MGRIETYARFKIHDGQLAAFRRQAKALVDAAKRQPPVRLDWFSSAETNEAAAIAIHRDEAALAGHLDQSADAYAGLLKIAGLQSLDQLGGADTAPAASIFGMAPRHFRFDGGVHEVPAFDPADGVIEIFTRFFIKPGEFEIFKTYADQVLAIVREKDPGTIRYDWFYDTANEQCIAMDTYAGWDGTIKHMKNCHVPHDELTKHGTMITEFLGEMDPALNARLAAFKPYILKYDAGLKPQSSGRDAALWPPA